MDAADIDKAEREINSVCAACGLTDEADALRCLLEFALSVGVSRVEICPWRFNANDRPLGVVVQFGFTASLIEQAALLRATIKPGEYAVATWKCSYGLLNAWPEERLLTKAEFVSRGAARLDELAQCAEFYAAMQMRGLL